MIFVFDFPSVTKKNKNYNEQFDELIGKWNNGYQFDRSLQKIATITQDDSNYSTQIHFAILERDE